MGIASFLRKGLPGVLLGWVSSLRFPYLFLLTTALFLLNLGVPDIIPFADEIIMGLGSLLLANLRKKPTEKETAQGIEDNNTE